MRKITNQNYPQRESKIGNIPRKAKEETQCKRAQKQYKTTQKREHPIIYADVSDKRIRKILKKSSQKQKQLV